MTLAEFRELTEDLDGDVVLLCCGNEVRAIVLTSRGLSVDDVSCDDRTDVLFP